MKILAIESSALVASAAIVEDELLKAEFTVNNKLTHSETLLPMIESMTKISGLSLSEIDAIAVSAGPGSFTGPRIGAATAKGLALALNIPVIRVSTLQSMAWSLSLLSDDVVCPVMDARRGQVYCAAYRQGAAWLDQLLAYLQGNVQAVLQGLADTPIRPLTPEGTYLMWLDCRALGLGDDELEAFFVQRCGVWMNNGYTFGKGGGGFMRLNVACPRATLQQALQRMRAGLQTL